jgi:hypothetical protein
MPCMTNSSEPDGAPSEDQLRDVCAELLTSWASSFAGMESVELGIDGQAPDSVRFAVVLAFAAHAHHVTTTAADLMHAEDYAVVPRPDFRPRRFQPGELVSG